MISNLDNFTLTAEPECPSITAKIPRSWKAEEWTGSNGRHKRAVDPDGCRWYWLDDQWTLSVPWFRGDDLAVVETINGNRAFPISKAGVITIGTRKISPSKWNH